MLSEAAELLADLVVNGVADDLLPAQPSRDRADPALHPDAARGARRARPRARGSLPTAPATRRSSGARSRRGSRSGELLAVVATDALELGIDIGELDAAICVTFPGTVASLRQMWGRAGRRSEGIALYVAGEDALDQFFCRHPDEFLARPVEAAILDHANERIQTAHVLAAAYEAPLGGSGEQPGADDDGSSASAGASAPTRWSAPGSLRRGRDGRYLPRGPGFPAGEISLRSASLDSVAVVERDSGELLGPVEAERAFTTVHPGRDLPAPRALLRGRRARRRLAPRDRRGLRRRLVHAAEEGDRRSTSRRSTSSAGSGRRGAARSSSTSARSRSPSR